MKKVGVLTLFLAVFAVMAFASTGGGYSNEQRIIAVDSPVYKAMENLYIIAGKALPSSSGPWSENEMALMLSRIDRDLLNDTGKKYYDYISSMVVSNPKLQYKDNLGISFGANFNLEGYVHTNKEFQDEEDWFHGFTSRKPFFQFTYETWATDHFYGYFELTFQHNYGYNVGLASEERENLIYKNTFNINVPILNAVLFSKPKKTAEDKDEHLFADLDWTVPYRAFVSFGGDNWNFMAGRDKLSWGSGETGNMMLSSSFTKQTFVRFNTYFEKFKYSILVSIYPATGSKESQYQSLDGYKALVVHRLEFNLFNNKVGLVVNEACMYWSTKDQSFSLAQINPFGFMHNEYIAENGNSLLVFELNYTPIKGINVYGQFAVDEFTGPGEGRENPAAFGFLGGVKGSTILRDGILYGSIEFAKTDPFLFIRGLHYEEDAEKRKGYGYDALLRIISCDRIILINKFVTYTYGNDVIILDGKINYEVPETFKVGFEAMYMVSGSMNVNSYCGEYRKTYDDAPDVKTPTEFNPFDTNDYDAATDTVKTKHAVEKSIILSLTGQYNILKNLKVYGIVDCLIVINQRNVADANETDLQATIGISYSL